MSAPAPEMASRYPGQVGDFGHRQAEHPRGIEDRGIRNLEATSGRLCERGRQEFLAGATYRRREFLTGMASFALRT